MEANAPATAPIRVFYCYSHKDDEYRSELESQLAVLRDAGAIDTWSDRRITAGDDWRKDIDVHLEGADVILLLVSAYFLQSPFIRLVELQRAIERHKGGGGVSIVPIIVRSCLWDKSILKDFQAIPENAIPLNKWRPRDDGYANAARKIAELVERVQRDKAQRLAQQPPPAETTTVPSGSPRGLPRRDPSFTGRAELLTDLRSSLTQSLRRPVTVALVGVDGVGKNAVAREYANRFASDYDLTWWVRSTDPTSITADLTRLASEVGVVSSALPSETRVAPNRTTPSGSSTMDIAPTDGVAKSPAVSAVLQWLAGNPRWLLVFEDARGPWIVDYLPREGNGHVIITSGNVAWGELATTLPVDPLSPDDCVRYFQARIGRNFDNESQAAQFVKLVGGLPLAVEQAVSFMEATGTSISDYIGVLEEKNLDEDASHLATQLSTLLDSLGRQSRAVALLNLLAWFAPTVHRDLILQARNDVPKNLGEALESRRRFASLIGQLQQYSLVAVNGETYSMHRLVQQAIRDEQSAVAQREWAGRAIRAVSASLPGNAIDNDNWPLYERYLPSVLVVANHAQSLGVEQERAANALWQIGDYQYQGARYLESRSAFEKALLLAESALGHQSPLVADILSSIGDVLDSLGDWTGAWTRYEDALAINRAVGPEPDVSIRLNNLGYLAERRRLFDDALAKYTAALEIDKKYPDDLEVAETMVNLGSLNATIGRLDTAREYYEDALALQRANDNPAEIAVILAALGDLYLDLGDPQRARASLEEAKSLDESWYAPDHPEVAVDLTELGRVHLALGDPVTARKLANDALEIQKARYVGMKVPEVARTYFLLGRTFEAEKRYEEAREAYEAALMQDDNAGGEKGGDLVALSHVLELLGRRDESIDRLQHAHRVYRESRGWEKEAADVAGMLRQRGVDVA